MSKRDFRSLILASLCIIAYMVFLLFSVQFSGDSLVRLVFAVLITFYVCFSVKTEEFGLKKRSSCTKKTLYLIPLWIMTSANLWGGINQLCMNLELLKSFIAVFLVGYVEEMLFRGLLFTALCKVTSGAKAVLWSSVAFGAMHSLNLFYQGDVFSTCLNVVVTGIMGFLWASVFYRTGSLWPCIVAHTLNNIFGEIMNNDNGIMGLIEVIIVVLISIIYGLYLMKLPSEKGRLFIMRHGTTDWNVIRKLQGQTDIPLNADGRALAEKAHDEYQDMPFDICFCSPLSRARETAALLLAGRDVPIVYDDRLKEMNFGKYEGLEKSFEDPACPINPLFQKPAQYVAPETAESLDSLFERTGAFLEEKVKPLLAEGKTVLIVGHGAMNCSIVCQVRKLPRSEFWVNGLEQCKLVELSVQGV